MMITEIKVQNVLGIRHAHVSLSKPVTIFAGSNGAGKSSLRAAIRLALTGTPERVSLKKDYRQLVTDGSKAGAASIWFDGSCVGEIKLPSGDHGEGLPAGTSFPRLNVLLDPDSFASMPANERRKFLFDLMGLQLDQASIVQRLLDTGCNKDLVEIIKPMLRAGFEAAHKDAASRMTEAKGAWRAVTGETWGAVKAEGWESAVPPLPAELTNLAGTDETLEQKRADLEAENQTMGGMLTKVRAVHDADATRAGLMQKAGQAQRFTAKLAVDEGEVAKWAKIVEDTKAKAEGGREEPHHECPACSTKLQLKAGGLVAYVSPEKLADPEAAALLPEYQRSLASYQNAVANDKRDIKAAEDAQLQLNALQANADAAPTDEQLQAQSATIAQIKVAIAQLESQSKTINAHLAAKAEAEGTTTKAARHHAAVLGWQGIADALSPQGIPSDLLISALRPINNLLRDYSTINGWKQLAIEADMTLAAEGRPYALLSESEKWRADAMIGAAISELSGIRVLFLDRIDVLDLPARASLIGWLSHLAAAGQLQSTILFGTLKALPSGLPAQCEAFWIEQGEIKAIPAAA